jgi:hypothetical protein
MWQQNIECLGAVGEQLRLRTESEVGLAEEIAAHRSTQQQYSKRKHAATRRHIQKRSAMIWANPIHTLWCCLQVQAGVPLRLQKARPQP